MLLSNLAVFEPTSLSTRAETSQCQVAEKTPGTGERVELLSFATFGGWIAFLATMPLIFFGTTQNMNPQFCPDEKWILSGIETGLGLGMTWWLIW